MYIKQLEKLIKNFIIPKGSTYYENCGEELVSSNIIYTGKYVRIGNSEEQLCVGLVVLKI